jgi:hypothetical protein
MNYADFDWELATKTGMFDVVRAMESRLKSWVKFSTNANIEKIIVENTCLQENGTNRIDLVWSDYHHQTKKSMSV